MASNLLRQSLSSFKETLAGHLTRLHELAVHTGNAELKQLTSSLVTNLNTPFLFVVVGEVKSGKSSFINALLETTVTDVAPDPCTDMILKIVYSPEPYEKIISDKIKEIGLPHDILKEISIVDTPGTNSIMETPPGNHRTVHSALRPGAVRLSRTEPLCQNILGTFRKNTPGVAQKNHLHSATG